MREHRRGRSVGVPYLGEGGTHTVEPRAQLRECVCDLGHHPPEEFHPTDPARSPAVQTTRARRPARLTECE